MMVLKNKKSGKTSGQITNYTKLKCGWPRNTGISISEHFRKNGGFGMNELLGIAAVLIIAAFVIIPGLRALASNIMDRLQDWWSTTIVSKIFSSN